MKEFEVVCRACGKVETATEDNQEVLNRWIFVIVKDNHLMDLKLVTDYIAHYSFCSNKCRSNYKL